MTDKPRQRQIIWPTTIALVVLTVSCGGPSKVEQAVPVNSYPEQIKCPTPQYPRDAFREEITGKVYVTALVDTLGNVRDAKVGRTSGDARLDSAAVRAAYKCKYTPGYQNGIRMAIWVTYPVEFSIH